MGRAHGLDSVASIIPVSVEDALQGASWVDYCDATTANRVGPCAEFSPHEIPAGPVRRHGDPVVITATDSCWWGSTETERRGRALAKLNRLVWRDITAHLERGPITQAFNTNAEAPPITDALSMHCALALAATIAARRGWDAVLHIPPELASSLPINIGQIGGTLTWLGGLRIVIGTGYVGAPPEGQEPSEGVLWAYVTGPVWVELSTIRDSDMETELKDNMHLMHATQVAVPAYHCQPVPIPIETTCPDFSAITPVQEFASFENGDGENQ